MKKILSDKGLIYTFLLCTVFVLIFYWKLLLNLNSIYFGVAGDGLLSYFSFIYHLKYSDTLLHFDGMNYPYGESLFFCSTPSFIVVLCKLIKPVIDVSAYSLAIFNGSILLSILLSGLFLYKILSHLKLPIAYSVVFAVLITFISPQLIRIGGHYSLAYVFIIPGSLWFCIRYYSKRTLTRALAAGLFTFIASCFQLYFLGFSILMYVVFHLMMLFDGKIKGVKSITVTFVHFFIQAILPFIILQLIIKSTDQVVDRTNTPWGFFVFTGNYAGLLYPTDKIYEGIVNWFMEKPNLDYEAKEYIGLFNVVFFFVLYIKLLHYLITLQFKKFVLPFQPFIINFLLISSFSAMLISFAFPFNTKWGVGLLDILGPLKQMRGIARFSWLFYYAFSIVAVWYFYELIKNKSKKTKYTLTGLVVLILLIDAYYPNNKLQNNYNNTDSDIELYTFNNQSDSVVELLKKDNYQAIISFPYYQNGSENIAEERGLWSLRSAKFISLKTGIPIVNFHMSRTSIGQSLNNFQLVLDPYRKNKTFQNFTPGKPLLIMVNDEELKQAEIDFINECEFITQAGVNRFYKMTYEKMLARESNIYERKKEKFSDALISSLQTDRFMMIDFEDETDIKGYNSNYARKHTSNEYFSFFNDTLKFNKPGEYIISFWMGNFKEDLIPRGFYEIALFDKYNRLYEYQRIQPGKNISLIDNDWALIEKKVRINHPNDLLKLTLWNEETKNKFNVADRLLIRDVNYNVVYPMGDTAIYVNNRIYIKGK